MTYQKKLSPWIIVRTQPDQQPITVGRYRRRTDAEGHVRALKQMIPNIELAIIFESGQTAVTKDTVT